MWSTRDILRVVSTFELCERKRDGKAEGRMKKEGRKGERERKLGRRARA